MEETMGIFKRSAVHIIPPADYIEHEPTPDCICGPRTEHNATGILVVHHSLDGREFRKKNG